MKSLGRDLWLKSTKARKNKKIYIMSMSPFLRKIEKGIFYEISH
ncbi:hypothetical protein NV229_00510 [Mesomycoplasma hyorhinis]|nr:hypothetical protein NV229_00510 [Mesomycoplasma hyorhinis]